MEELNLVPIYRDGLGEISPGLVITVPHFCEGKCGSNTNCIEHYKRMMNAEQGIHECPFGFCTFVFFIDEERFVFTCLKVTGHYNRKKLKVKISGEDKGYHEISKEQLDKYVQAYIEFYTNQRKYDEYRLFIEDIFHDVRKFNKDIKYKTDRIYRKAQKGKKQGDFLEIAKNILATSWFLSVRLNNHDFRYNMKLMEKDVKSTYNIHKIIFKVKECMKERAEENGLKISMSSNREIRDIKAYECIELLPYLFLDNSIKYSLPGTEIHIDIEEKFEKQHVHFESIGPISDECEQSRLVQQNVRGKYAEQLASGMGIGLYTAKCICDLNEIELKIESDKKVVKESNKIPYSKFFVDFYIQL